MNDNKVILASQSPRRRELLSRILDDFRVMPSHGAEVSEGDPYAVALQNAYNKALDLYLRQPDCVVIGSDTIVVIDGRILGKPKDMEDAFSMLRLLSGREHFIVTGHAVLSREGVWAENSVSFVRFKMLSDAEIRDYLATGEYADKAGSYAIQGIGSRLVEGYTGDFNTIVGLNVDLLGSVLSGKFGLQLKTNNITEAN